ncbi:hypothetical protein ATK23_2441 [Glutamicibacter mysorens]|uniref:IacB n=2 Tax=Glutamicibacter mysorens TaxID=257984 RepID=A0ABX4N036_9MICC|nr:hypothetical protein ATK23_2441 [Glutamicibacter mysorens]
MTTPATNEVGMIRSLLCIGVLPPFFSATAEERKAVFNATKSSFADLTGRFGVRVLGTFDDDTIQVGPSDGFPWTCYLLLDAPDYESIRQICSIIRDTPVGDSQLWKYYKIEARLGRPLFFGED